MLLEHLEGFAGHPLRLVQVGCLGMRADELLLDACSSLEQGVGRRILDRLREHVVGVGEPACFEECFAEVGKQVERLVVGKQHTCSFEQRDRRRQVGACRMPSCPRAGARGRARVASSGSGMPSETAQPAGVLEVKADNRVVGCLRLELLRNLLVESGPCALGDAVVGSVADERVVEAESLLVRRWCQAGAAAPRTSSSSCGATASRSSDGVRSRTVSSVKLRPATAARSSVAALVAIEAVEALVENAANRAWHLPREAVLVGDRCHLLDEERVSLGGLGDSRSDGGREPRAPRAALRVGLGEGLEHERRRRRPGTSSAGA